MVGAGWKSQLFTKYQVLVNEEGSARLEWMEWRQFSALKQGSVSAAKDIFVARQEPNAVWHNFLGGLHLHQQYGLIVVPPMGRPLTVGQVLVEHLPVKYELAAFKADRLRSVKTMDVILDEPIEPVAGPGGTNYTLWEELYLGRGLNIATGSRVTLFFNASKVQLQWGLPSKKSRIVRLRVPEGAPSQVMATRVEQQWDYFATLSAFYKDGAILMRPVKGVFR